MAGGHDQDRPGHILSWRGEKAGTKNREGNGEC